MRIHLGVSSTFTFNKTWIIMSNKKITPMMKQYNQIKSKYKDEILFFRLGDFYEMFEEDA
ncbi:MAG: hypothetical protein K9L24_01905, partial [Spirochaetia bacterium]|nr:hypothetical protein [Spirochaetia bacterium]